MRQNFNPFDLLVPPEKSIKYDDYVIARIKWEEHFDKLKIEKIPNIQELEKFFNQPPYQFNTIFHTLKLKYHALTTEPSAIEKTMSPYQLYALSSPFWTNELTAEEADAILKHTVGTYKLTEDEFNDRFEKTITGELTKEKRFDPLVFYW